ncbi:MAG: 4Fe-4S binding protein [Dehalococcoidia bacterium]|nr:MAG: 4Fe-4S binding protein [Dehalococcoidia bacterium]
MGDRQLYEELAIHLDQGIIGSPKSSALLEILEILFPVVEAEIAINLPLQNKTLSELKEIFPDRADSLEDTLNRMIRRGTVFSSHKPGQERKYRLLPSVVGWAETPFWAGKDTEYTRKLAPLWVKYREEAFGHELERGDMPVMRVVPETGTIEDNRQVLSFDELKPQIEMASYRAVGHCPCRLIARSVGAGCDHSLEVCLHFGSMGRYMVEYGMAREINVEETLYILKKANEEGLVHIIDNVYGYMSTICNCCGCCCVFLDTKKKMKLNTISSSNYLARVNTIECVGCGTCEERCPMEAITVNEDGVSAVNENICIGCGVCIPTCSNEAVKLVQRAEVTAPPDSNEFMAKRYKNV